MIIETILTPENLAVLWAFGLALLIGGVFRAFCRVRR